MLYLPIHARIRAVDIKKRVTPPKEGIFRRLLHREDECGEPERRFFSPSARPRGTSLDVQCGDRCTATHFPPAIEMLFDNVRTLGGDPLSAENVDFPVCAGIPGWSNSP